MNRHTVPVVASLAWFAVVVAQAPAESPLRPAQAPVLQSLQALLSETVYQREATTTEQAAAAGITHDRAFARVLDARFTADGLLVGLVVGSPVAADPARSLLPADAVRWDSTTHRWLTIEPALQLASLARCETEPPVVPPDPQLEPDATPRPWLASELLHAAAPERMAKAVAEASAGKDERAPSARLVWWLAPGAQQLAFAGVPVDDRVVLAPWSALRVDGGAAPRVHFVEAAKCSGAPVAANPDEPPSRAARHAAYSHFGVAAPPWEVEAEHAERERQAAAKAAGKG
jgi:hypothetical protein